MVFGQAEEAEVAQYFGADEFGVFTDAAGEDQRVQTAGGYGHAADVFGQTVYEHFHGQNRAFVAFGRFFFNGAAVVGQAG